MLALWVKAMDAKESEVEADFNEFWKDLVCKPDGTLDPEKVKRELFDFHVVMGEVQKVYDNLTGGKISKPNTRAEVVIETVEEHFSE